MREGCNRAGFSEQGDFATEYGSDHRCLVKLGCKGPVVKCNVPVRGWVNGIGGCPNVGGICMACTMPGFPDKYMPFMDEDRWGGVAANVVKFSYGPIVRICASGNVKREFDVEPEWRRKGGQLTTGYSQALVERSHDMATAETPRERAEGRRQGDVVGSDHPHRRVARHPHGDRLHQPAGAQVLLDVDDLPRASTSS